MYESAARDWSAGQLPFRPAGTSLKLGTKSSAHTRMLLRFALELTEFKAGYMYYYSRECCLKSDWMKHATLSHYSFTIATWW